MLLLTIALLVAGQSNLKTVYVATLPELVVAMEDPMVGRIFVNKSIALAGQPLPTLRGRLLEIEGAVRCGQPCKLDAGGRSRIFNVGPDFGSGLILSNLQLENAVARDGNGSAIMVFGGDGSSASGDFCTFVNNSNLAAAASSAASNAASLATTLAGGSGIPVGGYGYGGAVYGGEHTLIGFDNSYFSNNIASNGGAIGCYGCQLAVGTTTFYTNRGTTAGGAIYIDGGNASLSLSSSNLISNAAGVGGGGGIVLGAAANRNLTSLGQARSGISHANFVNNTADGPGGGLQGGPFATVAMDESVFHGNSAVDLGGGMAMATARSMAVANTTFTSNTLRISNSGRKSSGSSRAGASSDAGRGSGRTTTNGAGHDGDGDGAGLGGAGLSFGTDISSAAGNGGGFAASAMNNVSFISNIILGGQHRERVESSSTIVAYNGAADDSVHTSTRTRVRARGSASGGGGGGSGSAASGAGLLLNEGDMLFRNCTFDSNMNMLHVLQRSKPTGGNIGAEQDVCAFGATAQAIFGHFSSAICTACGGQGTCI